MPETPKNGYSPMDLSKAASYYRTRFRRYQHSKPWQEAIEAAVADVARKFGGDEWAWRLGKTVAVFVHKGKLVGEWRVG